MLKYQIIPVTSYQQNCSLLWCDQTCEAVLVDPGGETDRLLNAVKENKLNLKSIWLTHGHLDHMGATKELVDKTGIDVIGPHVADHFLIKLIDKQCEMFGFPLVEGFEPDSWLKEGDNLQLGNESFNVLHTPGHTPGHIILVHQASKMLWVGDVIFNHSIGRTDFPGGNRADLIHSIKSKLLTLDEGYSFVPGHGPNSTIGEEKRNNPFLI
jgi:hydroxyacylglutathione hydrolase